MHTVIKKQKEKAHDIGSVSAFQGEKSSFPSPERISEGEGEASELYLYGPSLA